MPVALERELEAHRVRRDEIQQQQHDQRVSAGHREAAGDSLVSRRGARQEHREVHPREEAVEVSLLHRPDVMIDLRPRAGEDEHDRQRQERDRQPQRRQGLQ
jgi:hypothetical protein